VQTYKKAAAAVIASARFNKAAAEAIPAMSSPTAQENPRLSAAYELSGRLRSDNVPGGGGRSRSGSWFEGIMPASAVAIPPESKAPKKKAAAEAERKNKEKRKKEKKATTFFEGIKPASQ